MELGMLACNLKNLAAPYLMVKDTLEATREGLNEFKSGSEDPSRAR